MRKSEPCSTLLVRRVFPPTHRATRRRFLLVAVLALAGAGCSQYIDTNVPEPIRPYVEPEFGRRYLLYKPAAYDQEQFWPLLVVCHTSFPDSPNRRLRRWTQLAEEKGFLLVAPSLDGVRHTLLPKARKQIALQRRDEAHILSVVNHVRASHRISDHRIFIHGSSGGALAALYTGLRHPTLFRTVTVTDPRFDSVYVASSVRIDPYQSVYVGYSAGDTLKGGQGRTCIEWLRSVGASARESSAGYTSERAERHTVEYIEEVLRNEPWIHITADPGDSSRPLEFRFNVRCSFTPVTFDWRFADGGSSPIANPTHTYAAPGTYGLTFVLTDKENKSHHRAFEITVPGGHVRPATLNRDN